MIKKLLVCILFVMFVFSCSKTPIKIAKYKIKDNTLIVSYYNNTEIINIKCLSRYSYYHYASRNKIGDIYSLSINGYYKGKFLKKDLQEIIKFLEQKQKEYSEKCFCGNYN